jgi:hypothetical protein
VKEFFCVVDTKCIFGKRGLSLLKAYAMALVSVINKLKELNVILFYNVAKI